MGINISVLLLAGLFFNFAVLETRLRYTLSKKERLTGTKDIDALFKSATSFSVYPLRVLYLLHKEENTQNLRAGFTVSTRNFKKAVDRNRIKRLLRESYRLQKNRLSEHLQKTGINLNVFIIYTGKEIADYSLIYEKIGSVIKKLEKSIQA